MEHIFKKSFALIFFALGTFAVFVLCFNLFISKPAFADYVENNLIDDTLFLDANSMSQSSIQTFLTTKGSYLAGYSSYSDRDSKNVLASQIIYEAAYDYGVSPKVILATIQKEEGLVTDPSPLSSQINYAMGYGCPDGGSCSYPGFYNQVANGTWQLRFNYERANGNNSWWDTTISYLCSNATKYYTPGLYPGNNVSFKDGSGVTYKTFTIQNASTASLYCYTPHAYPGDANYYYSGSYNFVMSYESWFGPATNPSLYFAVIQDPSSSALYLQTSAGKYYIPSSAIMQTWGLDKYPVLQVSQSYFDSIPTRSQVNRLLKDNWGNLFLVDNGELHYIRNSSYAKLWNLDTSKAVQSLGMVYTLEDGTWAGRFARDASQPTGQIWLMDNGVKRAISGNMLYEWGYAQNQLTTVSTDYLNSIPTANSASQYVNDGSTDYLIDMNRKLSFKNNDVANAFLGSLSPDLYSMATLSFLPSTNTGAFVIDTSNGRWYMLENGKKHYIASSGMAAIWGKATDEAPTKISNGLISNLPDGGNLQYLVQTSNPSMYWVIDGQKHYIANSTIAKSWIKSGETLPVYSTQSLDLLSRGSDATTTIKAKDSKYVYIMDNGNKRYLSSPNAQDGWGGLIMDTSKSLINIIPEGSFLNYIAKNADGQAYLLMEGKSYLIDPSSYEEWGVNDSTASVANDTVSRYVSSGATLGAFISIGNNSYVMLNGRKIPIAAYYDAYQPNLFGKITLSSDYFSSKNEATYLAKSTNSQDTNVWLINNGKKYLLSSFPVYVSYGYLSRSVSITLLAPQSLSLIPTATETPGLFIRKADSYAVKFVNFGTSLGFPDGNTLNNFLGSATILTVSDSIYNSLPLRGSASRVIKDDSGRIYFMENGKKRWITNSEAYNPFRQYPVTYLYGTTMSQIPNGATIN